MCCLSMPGGSWDGLNLCWGFDYRLQETAGQMLWPNEHQKSLQNAWNFSNFENSSVTWLAWFDAWEAVRRRLSCHLLSSVTCTPKNLDLSCSRKVGPLEMRWLEEQRSRVLSQQLASSIVSTFCWIRLFIHDLCRIHCCGLLRRWGSGRSFYITIGLARFLDSSCPNLKNREVMYFEWVSQRQRKHGNLRKLCEISWTFPGDKSIFQMYMHEPVDICLLYPLAWLILGCCDPHLFHMLWV